MASLNNKNRAFFRSSSSQSGQSLIEVIMATGVVALVMTALAASMTISVKSAAQSKYRALATKYGQEVLEVYRRERARMGWESFHDILLADGAGATYCLEETLPPTTQDFIDLEAGGTCQNGFSAAGTTFYREASHSVISADQVQVTVTVKWMDADRIREVELRQDLHNW
jgi:type II secretory pathway pseudopilin PulG